MNLKKKLENILKDIWDDRDFIFGVQCMLKNDADRQELIDAIEQGIIPYDSDDVILYALAIYNKEPFEEEADKEN